MSRVVNLQSCYTIPTHPTSYLMRSANVHRLGTTHYAVLRRLETIIYDEKIQNWSDCFDLISEEGQVGGSRIGQQVVRDYVIRRPLRRRRQQQHNNPGAIWPSAHDGRASCTHTPSNNMGSCNNATALGSHVAKSLIVWHRTIGRNDINRRAVAMRA